MRIAKLSDKEYGPFKEIVPAAGQTKQTWQLGHCDGQGRASLESDENAVADQFDERTQSQCPGEQTKHSHSKSRETGNLGIALRVPVRHRPYSASNHQRDGGGGSNC